MGEVVPQQDVHGLRNRFGGRRAEKDPRSSVRILGRREARRVQALQAVRENRFSDVKSVLDAVPLTRGIPVGEAW